MRIMISKATLRLTQEQRTDNSDRYHSNVIIGTKPKHGNYAKMKLHIKLVDRVGYSEEGGGHLSIFDLAMM